VTHKASEACHRIAEAVASVVQACCGDRLPCGRLFGDAVLPLLCWV